MRGSGSSSLIIGCNPSKFSFSSKIVDPLLAQVRAGGGGISRTPSDRCSSSIPGVLFSAFSTKAKAPLFAPCGPAGEPGLASALLKCLPVISRGRCFAGVCTLSNASIISHNTTRRAQMRPFCSSCFKFRNTQERCQN